MPNAIAMKVLVVDDQNSVRQMTRITLEQLGIRHIHEAENGKAAMETATLQPIDLIISDYNMPEMDGLEFVSRVRKVDNKVKIIMITTTARAQTEDIVQGIDAGADDFVTKPFDADLLFARLHVAERILGLQHHVKQLEGLLHICAQCKRIRDENKDWTQLERYITAHSNVLFSHGLCPDCAAAWERQMESMK